MFDIRTRLAMDVSLERIEAEVRHVKHELIRLTEKYQAIERFLQATPACERERVLQLLERLGDVAR